MYPTKYRNDHEAAVTRRMCYSHRYVNTEQHKAEPLDLRMLDFGQKRHYRLVGYVLIKIQKANNLNRHFIDRNINRKELFKICLISLVRYKTLKLTAILYLLTNRHLFANSKRIP